MDANGREFMIKMQAQSVEMGAIHPPSYDSGYGKTERWPCLTTVSL